MIDLHAHLLPNVDDGSRSVAQSVAVLERFAAEGVRHVCCTPHLNAAEAAGGTPAAHLAAFELLQGVLPPGITISLGAEIMLDRPLPSTVAEARAVTLGGTTRVLVEFPRLVAAQAAANALDQVRRTGLVPVLAHPERYAACTPGTATGWRQAGALLQVDATTLLSPRPRGDRARLLLEHGLGDILAADNHGDTRSLRAAVELLEASGAAVQARLLTQTNPAAILADAVTEPVPPVHVRRGLLARLRGLFTGSD